MSLPAPMVVLVVLTTVEVSLVDFPVTDSVSSDCIVVDAAAALSFFSFLSTAAAAFFHRRLPAEVGGDAVVAVDVSELLLTDVPRLFV